MNRTLLLSLAMLATTATAMAQNTTPAGKKLHCIETYGDAMGATGMTKKAVTRYGIDNRIERQAKYATYSTLEKPSDIQFLPYEITVNVYDEAGVLAKSYVEYYGRYDYGNMGFRNGADTTYYAYNERGQLTTATTPTGCTNYTYDETGNITQKTSVDGNHCDTITYSNFAGLNLPQLTISRGTLTSSNYMLETEYNAQGLKVGEKKSPWSNLYQAYRANQYEKMEYDEQGIQISDSIWKISISNDIENYTINSYTSFTPDSLNPNRITVAKRVWDNILKKFGNPKTTEVYEYVDIDAKRYSPTLTVEPVEDAINSVRLIVKLPEGTDPNATAISVYRKSLELAYAIDFTDAAYYDAATGCFVYTDSKVRNGNYDYYVELLEKDPQLGLVAHNVSNPAQVKFNVDLPSTTNLRELSRREESTVNSTDDGDVLETNIYLNLAWDEPENKEAYGFQRYNVMLINLISNVYNQVAENSEQPGLEPNYELDLRGIDSVLVYIQTVYDYGYAYSDSTLFTSTAPIVDAIEGVDARQATKEEISAAFTAAGLPVPAGYKGLIISKKRKFIKK